jgi:transcriptional regulator with XRE-family HTH domain
MAPQRPPSPRINGDLHRILRERSGYLTITAYTRALHKDAGVWVQGQHISNIEKGTRNPSDELFKAMVHVLKVPAAALLRCPGCPGCRQTRDNEPCPVCLRIAEGAVQPVVEQVAA